MTTRNEFLGQLFQYCEGEMALRAIIQGEPKKTRTQFCALEDYSAIEGFCKANAKKDLYFTVATRNGGGTKEHIHDIPAVWVDLDFKDLSKKEASKRLTDFPLRPTFCIESGHGFHVYWQLKEAYGKEDIPAIEALLRQLATALGGDMAATDASRILRVPDTKNFKYDPPRAVNCILARDVAYDLSDFEFLPDAAQACDPLGSTHINDTNIHYIYPPEVQHRSSTSPEVQQVQHVVDFREGGRDETLFSLANTLRKGGMPPATIEKFVLFFAKHCDPPFPKKEALAKIKSAFTRGERQDAGLTERVREFISSTWGSISSTMVCEVQQIQHVKDRRKVSTILGRLVKEGVLEKDPNRYGWYQVVDRKAEDIDFMKADTDPLPIRWPFGIESLVEIMPGNLAIVAGEIEAGKTAFLLNLAKLNMNNMETHYFSSEMAGGEMRKRLQKFDDLVLSEWTFKAHARAGAFHDVIAPNALNIVDFIEVHDEFYKIGHYLKRIHDKLSDGVAVVALQKPAGRDTGLGGDRSMEVARLYLSLSKEYPGGRLRITKGKNWATQQNPNGLSIKYKIVNGATLIQQGDWVRQ